MTLLKPKEASIIKRQPHFPVRCLLSESLSPRGIHLSYNFIIRGCRITGTRIEKDGEQRVGMVGVGASCQQKRSLQE